MKMRALFLAILIVFMPLEALAQTNPLANPLNGTDGTVTGRILQMAALLTAISLAPALLMMITCFTRFVIALSFLRSGLGLQSTPANMVLISLAVFMTLHVMSPTFDKAWTDGVRPLLDNKIDEREAFPRIAEPFAEFMRANVREKDLRLFLQLAAERTKNAKAEPTDKDLRVLIPAFIVSELRRGFEIGFLVILPFLVIDMIVATLVMSMGMMMVSPAVFSLPCKVLFFVLIDGWHLIINGLVHSLE